MNYTRRRRCWLLVKFLFTLLACEPSYSERVTSDSWETDPPTGELHGCMNVDSSLIAPVSPGHRTEAIVRLNTISFIVLSQRAAAELLDLPPKAPSASGVGRIKAAIGELEDQRRSALEKHLGSWSLATQDRLDRLKHLEITPEISALKPFLVRAVAKYEGTGAFSATLCQDNLLVAHLSLGHKVPRSTRIPVVVFLDHAPNHLYVRWSMAK